MDRHYIQLTSEVRDIIVVLRAQGRGLSEIARILGLHQSTICREFKRNKTPVYNVYLPHRAHQRAVKRKKQTVHRGRLKDEKITNYIIEKLHLGWSLEQIAGRISYDMPGHSINHEAIY